MTPLTITLIGAIGIRCGLGRETMTLDLTTLPEDALSVAIKGDNGMGKSTLLNIGMTPWREPPQIAGTMYDQFGETGSRELVWSHGAHVYRSKVEYRQTGKTKTQKAYLHRLGRNASHVSQNAGDGAEWQPVTLPDHTVSDGKSSTYDACLTHILGSRDIYYLSGFRAQGAAKLADYDNPKDLMRALLALDEPAMLAEQARDVARELKRAHASIKDQAAAIDGHPERIAELTAAVDAIDAGKDARSAAKAAALDAAAIAKAELERAVSGDLDRQRLLEQRAAIGKRLTDADTRTAEAVRQALDAETAARQRIADAETAGRASIAAIERDIQSARARVAAAEKTLANRAEIEQAEADAGMLAAQIDGQEQTLEAQRQQIESLSGLAAQIRTLEAQQAHAAADGKAGKARLDELEARAGFVSAVPCKGKGEFAACPALAEAIAAEGQIAEAKVTVDARREEWKAIAARIKTLGEQTADLPGYQARALETKTLIGTLRVKLDALRATAAQAATLAMAEQNLADAQAAVADLDARRIAAIDALVGVVFILSNDFDAAQALRLRADNDRQSTLTEIRGELLAVPEPGTDQAVTHARERLAAAEAAVESAAADIDQASATVAQHTAEIASLRREIKQGAEITARARALEAEIADWTLLGTALRGVIDLSIEDAGPGIAALANQLLTEAYGPRFTVRIVTQREQANGIVKECFDISVIDAETGIESSVIHKSGGESVWIDKALTDAVGLYHQDAAGQHYECLFADESDDGLTQERKAQFYRMDRAALAMGGYRRKFFVSHNPDAWASADYVIDLAQYKQAA
jgi:exonuclease SbcC